MRRYFFFIFQLFQFDQITVETLYNGHLRDIEESGHSRRGWKKSECMSCMDRPPKKNKNDRVERWPLRKKHLILTEINEGILLSIDGYCVCRDRYTVFRKLPHSRKLCLYLCMNSASRIFFSASFLSVYEVVRTTKKKFAWLACLHRTPTSNTKWVIKKLCELVSGHKRLTKNSAGNS